MSMSTEPTEVAPREGGDKPDDPEAAKAASRGALSGVIRTTAVAAVAMTLVAAVVQGPGWAVGTLIGGVLATLNLIVFARIASAFVEQRGKSAPWAVIGGIKLLGLFLAVYLILSRGEVSALAFILGYGSLPIGISLGSLRQAA
jgi:hypothetical protein